MSSIEEGYCFPTHKNYSVHQSSAASTASSLAMQDRIQELEAALKLLYEETADYIRVNHLGDVHHKKSMQAARDALNFKTP